jgi:hypothetical protein
MPKVSAPLLEMHEAVVCAPKQGVAQDLAAGQAISQDLDGSAMSRVSGSRPQPVTAVACRGNQRSPFTLPKACPPKTQSASWRTMPV